MQSGSEYSGSSDEDEREDDEAVEDLQADLVKFLQWQKEEAAREEARDAEALNELEGLLQGCIASDEEDEEAAKAAAAADAAAARNRAAAEAEAEAARKAEAERRAAAEAARAAEEDAALEAALDKLASAARRGDGARLDHDAAECTLEAARRAGKDAGRIRLVQVRDRGSLMISASFTYDGGHFSAGRRALLMISARFTYDLGELYL